MDRITKEVLHDTAVVVNSALRHAGSVRHVEVSGRYDYTAVDEYEGTACVRLLKTGTKREVHTFLTGMLSALTLADTKLPVWMEGKLPASKV